MTENKTQPEAPVEIAGAGPAGLAAAIILARAGRKVIVYEMQKEVGHRFGGDFQGLENWSTTEDVLATLAALGLATDFNAMPCRKGTIFDAADKRYEIKSNDPLFYMVERGPGPGSFDTATVRLGVVHLQANQPSKCVQRSLYVKLLLLKAGKHAAFHGGSGKKALVHEKSYGSAFHRNGSIMNTTFATAPDTMAVYMITGDILTLTFVVVPGPRPQQTLEPRRSILVAQGRTQIRPGGNLP